MDCKDCEQKQRNLKKNKDRALYIIKNRARHHGIKDNLGFDFMWVNMNWQSLVPIFRAMMTDEGLCTNCGHPFLNERDIQIEHREPPRFPKDLARIHARNIGLFCDACNKTKGNKPFSQWLDEQEQARLSNEVNPSPNPLLEEQKDDLFSLIPVCGSSLRLLPHGNPMPKIDYTLQDTLFIKWNE